MKKEISQKLKNEKPEFSKHKRESILKGKNYRISSLFEFLENTQYFVCLNGKKCNNVDDMRKIIASQEFSTYDFSQKYHFTSYRNFITGKRGVEIDTLLGWFEYFGIECKLIKG